MRKITHRSTVTSQDGQVNEHQDAIWKRNVTDVDNVEDVRAQSLTIMMRGKQAG